MSEMIRRVAAAMNAKARERGTRPLADFEVQHLAAAAIAAMREPTEAMLAAGLEHEGTDLASEYRAMIDAASHG